MAALATAALLAGGGQARAEGSSSGSLGRGGVAVGDVSKLAGEGDEVTVDLLAGAAIDVTFVAAFRARLVVTDPDGAPFAVPLSSGPKPAAKAVPVTRSGIHRFRVTSIDGSQGRYTLSVLPKWPKKATFRAVAGTPFGLSLPEGATISGKAVAFPSKSFDPQLASIAGPAGGEVLKAPLAGKRGAVKIPKLSAPWSGAYRVLFAAPATTGEVVVALKLKVPKVAPSKLDLTNGIVPVSFAKDGVATLFATRCQACHTWAANAATAKPQAKASLARIVSGNMPKGGPKLPAADAALVRAWIDTGMAE